MKKIVLTGGGSAGHVTPNIALVPKLRELGYDILYIGSKKGIEKELIQRENIEFKSISSGKLRRYFDVKNFTDPFCVIKGLDIHDSVRNATVSGFLPIEREWLDKFMKSGFIDSFRYFHKEPHQYSWWSYRANARNNNKGWRIDYHLVSAPLENRMERALILPEAKHSDHCPIVLEVSDK